MRIARFLIYDGPVDWLKMTLAHSLSEGTTDFGRGMVTIIQFPDLEVPNKDRLDDAIFKAIDRDQVNQD